MAARAVYEESNRSRPPRGGGGAWGGARRLGGFLRNHERGRMPGERPTPGPVQERRGRRLRVTNRDTRTMETKRARKKNSNSVALGLPLSPTGTPFKVRLRGTLYYRMTREGHYYRMTILMTIKNVDKKYRLLYPPDGLNLTQC